MGARALSVAPISPVLGARIEGVDLARPTDAATFGRLEAALHAHGFIVLPGQHLSPRDLVAFGQLWGPPDPQDRKSVV